MNVSFLPIVGRELRITARKRGTYIVRCATPLAVFLLGGWFFLIMPYAPPVVVAKGMFSLLSGAALLYAFVSGVHFTADSLSEEKREGTLGLLFLTDLKGYDVVLGKLAATSLGAFYGMLAMLPMLAIPLLIGGISFSEVLRMSGVAINTMFMSLTAGLFLSSIVRAHRYASGLTLMLLVSYGAILPMGGSWISYTADIWKGQDWWMLASPGYAYACAFDSAYSSSPEKYWICMAIIHALGWAWLVSASLIAPRAWQDRPVGVNRSLREKMSSWSFGTGQKRAAFRHQLLNVNPWYWLASRSRFKPMQVWLVLGLGGLAWGWGWFKIGEDWLDEGILITTALVLNLLLKGWFATECTRQLSEDRHRGAFELLLSTPLSVHDILRGQLLALRRQFLAPLALTFILYIAFMCRTLFSVRQAEDRHIFFWLWLLGIAMFVMDFVALYWVGIWMALKSRKPRQASSAACVIVLIMPWVLFAIGMMLLVSSMLGARSGPNEWGVLAVWAITGFGVDIIAIAVSRQNILDSFRLLALQRSVGKF